MERLDEDTNKPMIRDSMGKLLKAIKRVANSTKVMLEDLKVQATRRLLSHVNLHMMSYIPILKLVKR
jgi:hypothetical protein